jgi:hypothetical protein
VWKKRKGYQRTQSERKRTGSSRKSKISTGACKCSIGIWAKALLEKIEKEEEEEARKEAIREQRAKENLKKQTDFYDEVRQHLKDTEVLKKSVERSEEKVYDLKLTIEWPGREAAIDRLRAWISPPQYLQAYEKALSEREKGTRTGLYRVIFSRRGKYRQWSLGA